ncbi:MAG: IS110 family transposase [Burkholderiales bacterium]
MPIYCGVDFHSRQQHVVWCDTNDGEIWFIKLDHSRMEKVREFYAAFSGEVIVGLEATGYSQWFEDLLFELKIETRIGDAAEIRKRARSRQKTDRRDAETILDLLLKNEFPRIYRPDAESRSILQKLRHRHRLVQLRTKAINHLHAIAISAGLSIKSKLMTMEGRQKLNALLLSETQKQQRDQWLALVDHLTPIIQSIEKELAPIAQKEPRVTRLMTQPGIGLLTGLALVHTLGPIDRFANARKVTAYIGLDPLEDSSGDRKRIGSISKQGSRLVRFLLVEAAQTAARRDPDLKRFYHRVLQRRDKPRAKVAVARQLLVRAYILLRDEIDYAEFRRRAVKVDVARVTQ